MKAELIWVLKTFLGIVVLAFAAIMVYRIWYWMDNCVINERHVYPPIYACGVHPFNFEYSYIDMLRHNRAMLEKMSERERNDDFSSHGSDRFE